MKIKRKQRILCQIRKWLCCMLALFLFAASCPAVCAAEKNNFTDSGDGNSETKDSGESSEETDDGDKLLAPYFIIQGSGDEGAAVERFPLKSTDVVTNINGLIAETYVTQIYVNEGDVPINASYVFPTSSGVSVHGMKMIIGNEMITAQIKEKEEAKVEYEEAKSEGKSASLMEQKRPNVFTMDVANIMPGDTVSIELHYTELLAPTENVYEFIFPTVVGPRYAPPEEPSGEDGDASGENGEPDGSSVSERDGEPDGSSVSERDGESDGSSVSERDGEPDGSSVSERDGEPDGSSVSGGDSANAGNGISVGNGSGTGSGLSEDDSWIVSPYLADGATPPGDYNITVNLSTGVPIADITSKTHAIKVNKTDSSTAQITLANPADYAGNRDFILKYKLTGESIQSGLVLAGGHGNNGSFKEEQFFMLTIQPPERFEPEDIPPREYIFVLDVSGSMFGYPLDTAKELIHDLVADLKETDTFNLILFANDTMLLSPRSLPATAANIKTATKLIDEQEGGGGTSLLPALEDAIAVPKSEDIARSIVIITDGYISNESEVISCITDNMDSASFFSFGIGSSVNDYLIKQVAGCGLGESFIVTDKEDAEESAENFRTYIEAPLLTDISITYKGFEVYDVEPAVPSILYASQPIVLFGKWRGKPGGTITVTGKAGGEEYVQEIPVGNVTVDMESEAIRYLWARTHLDRIAGYGSVRNDESVKEEITQLGLEYNMITPYTSFIAVSEIIRNTDGDSKDVDQALPLPQRVSNLAVGGGYRAYSEPGMLFLSLAAAAVMIRKKFARRSPTDNSNQ
ncbi:MAG: VWA domain-containing protein [Lachnospiraceae bacterium]|nr:VWA domain-containing protein [Lachnospiraceae bacterium]